MSKKQISDIQGGIWLIGLAILFITGKWWPGILILIGVSMLAGSLLNSQEETPAPAQIPGQPVFGEGREASSFEEEDLPDPSPRAAAEAAPSPAVLPPIPLPKENDAIVRPVDRLPETCEACGAPVRGMDVHWTGFDTASCGFCGSNLKMKEA